MNFLERLSGENAKEYAYRVLKDNIMSLELKPGQNINESELAEQLNISRTPIREILMKLKEEHLIEVKPQIGTYVSLLEEDLIEEAFFMRYHLEKEVLKLACNKFPEDKLEELEKSLMQQNFILGKQNKILEFHRLDIEFHGIIFSGVNLQEVWKGILRISTHYNRMRLLSELKHFSESLVKQHEEFINVIRSKDIDAIEPLLFKHFKEPKKYWNMLFDSNSQYKDYFREKK
ncbi:MULTISPECIES: GntR family transcriptional regulator [Clostridium]|uniref:GntR family transcriptional regulator n=1 Tax=Clostridium TaxID=1485 RepID=UPI000825652B|nr:MULTISPECIES: GntR family transcriptional regulator [Clostridium]PJI09186.1 GntR family transcriptional regulator [Clostridium sp. CT7]